MIAASFKRIRKSNHGQVLVEYLLLMTIAVACAAILTKSLITRNESDPGMIISAWNGILKKIANDLPDCSKQTNFADPTCPRN